MICFFFCIFEYNEILLLFKDSRSVAVHEGDRGVRGTKLQRTLQDAKIFTSIGGRRRQEDLSALYEAHPHALAMRGSWSEQLRSQRLRGIVEYEAFLVYLEDAIIRQWHRDGCGCEADGGRLSRVDSAAIDKNAIGPKDLEDSLALLEDDLAM